MSSHTVTKMSRSFGCPKARLEFRLDTEQRVCNPGDAQSGWFGEARGHQDTEVTDGAIVKAYGFLVSERETIPPSGSRSTRPFKRLAVSNGYRPRGSAAATRTSHPELDCDDAAKTDRCHRPEPLTLSLLHSPDQTDEASSFVTQ